MYFIFGDPAAYNMKYYNNAPQHGLTDRQTTPTVASYEKTLLLIRREKNNNT